MDADTQMKRHWNRAQLIILIIGMGAAVLALLYPPYVVCGGFFCGDENAYYKTTQVQFIAKGADELVKIDKPLYICQIVLPLWVTTVVLLLLKQGTSKLSVTRGFVAGEAGIIALGVARTCLDWNPDTYTRLSDIFHTFLFFATFGGFNYSCVAILSALILLLVSAARLFKIQRERLQKPLSQSSLSVTQQDIRVWPPPPGSP